MYALVCSCRLSQFQFSDRSENVVCERILCQSNSLVTLTAAVLSEVSVEK